jgi:hypothetical protein
MTKRYGIVGLVLLLVMVTTSTAAAGPNGTDRPFKGEAVGEATFLLDNPLGCAIPPVGFGITTATDAYGTASHLGYMSLHSDHCPLLDGSLSEGKMVFIAANGDELHSSYTGEATPVPPNIGDPIFVTTYISFDPVASTGRFAGATGEAVLHGELVFEGFDDTAWPWWATWEGTVSY